MKKNYAMIITEESDNYEELMHFADHPWEGMFREVIYGDDFTELQEAGDNEGLFYQLFDNHTGERIGIGVFDDSPRDEIEDYEAKNGKTKTFILPDGRKFEVTRNTYNEFVHENELDLDNVLPLFRFAKRCGCLVSVTSPAEQRETHPEPAHPEAELTEENSSEFIGQIIDIFEDFLDEKNIVIPNPEKDDNRDSYEDPDSEIANLYGSDYGEIQTALEDMMDRWDIRSSIPDQKKEECRIVFLDRNFDDGWAEPYLVEIKGVEHACVKESLVSLGVDLNENLGLECSESGIRQILDAYKKVNPKVSYTITNLPVVPYGGDTDKYRKWYD